MFLLEQVVNGLVLGGCYLLIALGLSLIFSVGGAAAKRERVSNLIKNVATNIPVLIVEHDIDRVTSRIASR